MDRRTFVVSSAALLAAGPALAGVGEPYSPGLVDKRLAEGKTVFVDFYTDWCSTCKSQERTVNALLKANPEYEKHIAFVAVDWDVHSKSKLAKRLNIPRRSTLVVLSGDQELGRIVAGTRKSDIQSLLDKALTAATS